MSSKQQQQNILQHLQIKWFVQFIAPVAQYIRHSGNCRKNHKSGFSNAKAYKCFQLTDFWQQQQQATAAANEDRQPQAN